MSSTTQHSDGGMDGYLVGRLLIAMPGIDDPRFERAVVLMSNPGETVLTPFMGVGSEVYGALINGRRGIGVELKESYYRQALKNLAAAEVGDRKEDRQVGMFDDAPGASEPAWEREDNDSVDRRTELEKELGDAYEKRTAKYRVHATADGFVEIPQTAIANAIKEGAKRLSLPIKGKRMQTYTKNFQAGVMVLEPIVLPVKADDVALERLFLSSDGRPGGGGKRVWRFYPRIDSWKAVVKIGVFDDIITEDVFGKVLASAGQLVGIGRFRPENRGY